VRQLHVIVRGRVQGVGFRWFVREEARRRDLAGWVQNRPDGGVEVAAAGPAAALEAFEAQLRIGPSGAHVTQLESIGDSINESNVALAKPFAILR
jgi:acylphosphatase